MAHFTESEAEEAALGRLAAIKYDVVGGPDIAPGEPRSERVGYCEVALVTNDNATKVLAALALCAIHPCFGVAYNGGQI